MTNALGGLTNTAPNFGGTLAGQGSEISYVENAAPVILNAGASVFDAELAALDGGVGNYAGASLTLARSGGASTEDVFSAVGSLSFSNGNAVLSGITVGTVSQGAGQLSITFNENATQERVNEVLSHIGYSNTSDLPPSSVELNWTLLDGSGADALAGTATSTVSIQEVNDPFTGNATIASTSNKLNSAQGDWLMAAYSGQLSDRDGTASLTYEWLRDGRLVDGATSIFYRLTQADVGHSITSRLVHLDLAGHLETLTSAPTVPIAEADEAPTGSVSIQGYVGEGKTVTATHTLVDPDGMGAVSWQWLLNGVAIEGATDQSYTLSTAQINATLSVRASYVDGDGVTESVVSSGRVVNNVNDGPTGEVTISGTARQGETLTASNTLDDADGMGVVSYQWLRAGTAISGATGASYTATAADAGKAISVKASYVDGYGAHESRTSAATAPVENVNDAPTGEVTVSGTARQGEKLTASNTLADADGMGLVSYQWLRDGTAISYATGTSYTLTQADVGRAISVTASYVDGFKTAESRTSAATAPVENVNDPAYGTVGIIGAAKQGQTLTAATSVYDADGVGTLSYQWLRDGVDIAGATLSTYKLEQADVGRAVSLRVRFTDKLGSAESLVSNPTAAVANVNDAPTGTLALSGTARQGETLSVANMLDDADGMGPVSYQWLRDGVAFSGATGESYALTQADVGHTFAVKASYVDGFGYSESRTSAATAPVANVNDAPTGEVTITGTATQGQTLTASNTLADQDGMGIVSYQWLRDGVAITGAKSSTYLLAPADAGHAVSVLASYFDRYGTAESVASAPTAAVANVNDAPTGTVSISGTVRQGETLTASNTLADADGMGAVSYQWLRAGVAIDGATGASYTLTQADVGRNISVKASYVDGFGTAESRTSSITAVVANVNDAPTGAVTISGTVTQGQSLTAVTSTLADADGLGSPSYQWMRDGTNIPNAVYAGYTLTAADAGHAMSVRVSYTDRYGTAENVVSAATAPVVNVNDMPYGSVNISGTARQGETLTASNTLSDADGLGAVSYQWLRAGVAIDGATGASYTLTQADVGRNISVKASYVDGFGTAESRTSSLTAVVANVNDAPTGEVTISGTATQGQMLKAVTSTLADADGLGTLSYQWQRDGVDINLTSARMSTYTLTPADAGHAMSVRVSYTDRCGTFENVVSAATAPVVNVNDAPTGTVSITGTARQGETLTATSTLADADGLGVLSYQWLRAGTAIGGATGANYTLTQADVGKAISVKVSYVDGFGTAESRTSGITAAVENVNDLPTGEVSISGTAAQGQTLQAVADTLADADGLGTLHYQWLRDGADIAGATLTTYTLAQADVGSAISLRVSYTDKFGTAENVVSAATAAVANVNDPLTGTVTISGTARQGETLVADTGTLADADGLGTLHYQWLRGGEAIDGATGATYQLAQADVGQAMSVRVSYVDGFGAAESVSSAATAAVANVNDAPTGGVSIAGEAAERQTLSASHTLADADGLSGPVSYQWLRDGVVITGATASTYRLTLDDVGHGVSVRASYVDDLGQAESVTSAATASVRLVNMAPTFQRQGASAGAVAVDVSEYIDEAYGVFTQPDGKIVMTGRSNVSGYGHFSAVRLNADGSLDTSFSGDGKAVVDNFHDDYALCAAVQADGKIVMAGGSTGMLGDSADFRVVRLNADGTLDTTFADNGRAAFNLGGTYDSPYGIAVQPDGKIVVTGAGNSNGVFGPPDFTVVRLNADGTLDTSFDGDGRATVDINGYYDTSYGVTLQPDGKVLVVGNTFGTESAAPGAVARLNADGSLDTSFSGDGKASIDLGDGWGIVGEAMVMPDGRIVLMASTAMGGLSLVRLMDDGTLDATFGNGGKASPGISGFSPYMNSAVLQPDGKVVVAGTIKDILGGSQFGLMRLNADGSLDTGFSGDGLATFDVGRFGDKAYSVTLQSDGKLLVSGSSAIESGIKFLDTSLSGAYSVIRVNADGTLDTSFGAAAAGSAPSSSLHGTASYTEGAAPVVLDTDAVVYDRELASTYYDMGMYRGATLTLSRAAGASAQDVFTGLGTLSLTGGRAVLSGATVGTVTNAAGVLSITFDNATQDSVNQVLRHIGYSNTSDAPPASVDLKWTFRDGSGADALSVSDTTTVLLQNVDDPLTGTVSVYGTTKQGWSLSISSTLADKDGLGALSYQWLRDGEAITGANKSGYTLTQADVGKAVAVTVTYTDAYGHAESRTTAATALVQNVNDLPTGSVSITGTAKQGQTVTAAHTLADADGLGIVSWQWLLGGQPIEGATGPSYTLTQAEVGKALSVRASYIDGYGTAESKVSGTVTVANVNDAPTGEVLINGTVRQGETITASNTLADLDGMGPVSYQWLRAGSPVYGATGASYTLTQADVGKAISVKASYTDGYWAAESKTSAAITVANLNDAPSGTVSISGVATQNRVLSGTVTGLADPDGLGPLSYQWLRGGVAIPGATGTSYMLTQADVGQAVSMRVSYVDGYGTAESLTSTASAPVANVNDAPTGAVTIGGLSMGFLALQHQTLTAVTSALADPDGLGVLSYQWLRSGVAIEGATGAAYEPTQVDVGKSVNVKVSYVDGGGTAETVASAAAPVDNVNDAPTGEVLVSGTARQGQVLTASNTLADLDGMGAVSWQWLRADTAVTGATGASYTLTQADVGKAIAVKATYTDGFRTVESVTSAATAPVENVNDAPTGSVGLTVVGAPSALVAVQHQTLAAVTTTLADIDGLGVLQYQWISNSGPIAGATGATYELTQADVGKSVKVQVSYVDGGGTLETLSSSGFFSVYNVNDAPTGEVLISGTVRQGETLTVSNTLDDLDGMGPVSYLWLRDGVGISKSTSITLTQADVGHSYTVKASYTDGFNHYESVSSAATAPVENVNDPASGSVSFSGTAVQNQTLTAYVSTVTDADGVGALSYQWLRGGVAIPGATGLSYKLTQADVGQAISMQASFVDGCGTVETLTSKATAAVANVNDMPTGGIALDGLAVVGYTLKATSHVNDADGMGPVSLQWMSGSTPIAGATGDSYTVTSADLGRSISVVASYVDGFNHAERAYSFSTPPVDATFDSITGDANGVVTADVLHSGSGASLVDGRAGNDQLWGEAGSDTLIGGDGDDTLYGGAGCDVLQGGAGADVLVGGIGSDQLEGGAGADLFVLQSTVESLNGFTYPYWPDGINDFVPGEDRIDLSGVDADTSTATLDAFTTLIGASAAFTAPGQLRFVGATSLQSGDSVIDFAGTLYGNTDADADPEFAIMLLGVSALSLSDLVLTH